MEKIGIINVAQRAKIEHEQESIKETISFAWSASMSRYYEDVAKGIAKEEDKEKYFSRSILNSNIGTDDGNITDVVYNNVTKRFEVIYKKINHHHINLN